MKPGGLTAGVTSRAGRQEVKATATARPLSFALSLTFGLGDETHT